MTKKVKIECQVNGKVQEFEVYPMTRVLDALREQIHLSGTKEGCGEGECGACAVLMNGRLVNSCLVPMAQAAGCEIETVESLAKDGQLSALQKSFLECGGAQCGICTPGMLMASYALLKRNPKPSLDEVKFALAGNLCRCTGYMKIFDSVLNLSCAQDTRTEAEL